MCPSKKLLSIIEQSFDDNDDRSLNQDERIMLYTTLAIAPDIVILKVGDILFINFTQYTTIVLASCYRHCQSQVWRLFHYVVR